MNVLGLIAVIAFYLIILACGIWIAKSKGILHPKKSEDLMLAGRSLGLFVGTLTLVATEVGGAFVNGTAEVTFNQGVLWALAPIGYSLSMTINGLFFVDKLRKANCVTLIDALQSAYGVRTGGLIYAPSCIGDVCWTAAVLSALGSTISVILDIQDYIVLCVVVSAVVAVIYTLIGGMYAVAYTDVIQLGFIVVGLWVAIPFLLTNPATKIQNLNLADWTGRIQGSSLCSWLDYFLLIICGGIPWQPYYQRALAVRSSRDAKILSVSATFLCLICMIPPVLIGGLAKSVDWSNFDQSPLNDTSVVLPVTVQQVAPNWVGILTLSAVR